MINKANMVIQIKPAVNATNRTRNRIREHGPKFKVIIPNTINQDNSQVMLCRSIKDGWVGWFSKNECLHLNGRLVK